MEKLNVIFMGTPEFALPCLKRLTILPNINILGVVTQPDKKQGRGQRVSFSPIKEYAVKENLQILQPEKIKNNDIFFKRIKSLNPDLIVVVAFGQILPKEILEIPKHGCINVHASLLPKYRGAAPMQWAIINGEKKTGITTMQMNIGLDTGDILKKLEVPITENMTLEHLHDLLMEKGAALLEETIYALKTNNIKFQKQNDALSSYAPMITKETGRISWKNKSKDIHNLIRGLNSWPGAYTLKDNKIVKIWKTLLTEIPSSEPSGKIIAKSENGILVSTGDNLLEICEIQVAGKKKMPVKEYMKGNPLEINSFFE